mmetsp:Transcript_26170/g.61480  ORF Transcript_26170/g.61480 Transcript_26170/m.61480 type:complete len:890 (+) Transcript_26170:198-2867(+)
MSSYPTTNPTNKHDLFCAKGASNSSSPSAIIFSSSAELFKKVLNYDDKDFARNGQPEKKGFVYSYKDGPEYPGPLSRSLLVLGYADRSLSAVRKIVDADTSDDGGLVCDGLHSCSVAVQLADVPKRYDRLEKRHQVNSTAFARYVTNLRESRKVAILAKDKYSRFGILVPFEQSPSNDESSKKKSEFGANDFAARVYIGDVTEVMNFLAVSSGANNSVTEKYSGGWKPTTPPPPSAGSGSSWKPTTPPVPSGDGGNPWESTADDENDGSTFRPDNDDDDDGPTFRPDNDDNNNDSGGGWKASTPPMHNGSNNGGSMPWESTDDVNGASSSSAMPWEDANSSSNNDNNTSSSAMPWEQSADNDEGGGGSSAMPWDTGGGDDASSSNPALPWATDATNDDAISTNKRSFDDMNHDDNDAENNGKDPSNANFHSNTGAAAADAFYSGLTRNLATRDKSWLYHMKCFNNWVKATQIAELDPNTGTHKQPLRVLDLACGKGGDLTKWTIHKRGMRNYVGIDVARGSLKDAAERARGMRKKNKLTKAVFSCADLGSDVPGRLRHPRSKRMQKLLTWSLEDEAPFESGEPEFNMVAGGGISHNDQFDIVSIQFAIHYMMQTGTRARRFFHTVSQLLDIGGNLAFTTIDARVIVDHMMNLGHNYHFEEGREPNFSEVVVEAGGGACKLRFQPHIVKQLLECRADGTKGEESLFGLEYTFTLVEGEDHAAGMGDAVNLPEWLIPIPVLVSLGKEAGLELEYAQNFHEFYEARSDPDTHRAAHTLLTNMKVPNRHGTLSEDEWSIIRLYLAVKFRKVRESSIVINEDGNAEKYEEEEQEEDEEEEPTKPKVELDPIKVKKMYPMAMMKAKRAAGDQWNTFTREEKEERTQIELVKLAAK